MDRKLVVLVVAVALLLAGCSGGNGGAPEAADGTEAATPQEATAGEHPAVTEGTVDTSTLVQEHLTVLRGANSFTVLNNRTVTFVDNGSVAGRSVLVNRADVANQRQLQENRVLTPDGDIRDELIRFGNATTTCTLRSGEYECFDGGVSTQRILGSTIETTSLETFGAPDFAPDGIADREGQSLYRYSASAFRTSMDSESESKLFGTDPTLVEATMLVHPSGRIVEYSLTYRTGDEPSQELDLTYATTAINATTFEPLDPPE
jgi:hypothetical protein